MMKNLTIFLFLLLTTISSAFAISLEERTLGEDDAPVTIEMYTDLQGPFCSRWHKDTFPSIKENYIDTGEAKLIVKHFPLSFHTYAKDAAIAAQCAAEQDEFYDYIDILYHNQNDLEDQDLRSYAEDVGLDLDEFDECYSSPYTDDAVNAEFDEGTKRGVTGTPTFYINDFKLVGAQPYSSFAAAIDGAEFNLKARVTPTVKTIHISEDDEVRETIVIYNDNDVTVNIEIDVEDNIDDFVEVLEDDYTLDPSEFVSIVYVVDGSKAKSTSGHLFVTYESSEDSKYSEIGVSSKLIIQTTSKDQASKCVDSDGGIEKEVKGTATQYIEGDAKGSVSDSCVKEKDDGHGYIEIDPCKGSDCFLMEIYCNYEIQEGGTIFDKVIDCPQGCKNGACKEEKIVRECTTGQIKEYTCPDKSKVTWCTCSKNEWECKNNPDSLCKPIEKCPTGCEHQDSCLFYGQRVQIIETGYYCDISKEMKAQKTDGSSCQNSYECGTNICTNGECGTPCNGCKLNDNCYGYGTRIGSEFCDTDGNMKTQKTEEQACLNNHECETNVCINNQCVSPSFIQKFFGWLSKLFG